MRYSWIGLTVAAQLLSGCVTPGTMTWPGVDPRKADIFRETLYEECLFYPNTHNLREGETLADITPRRFVPEDVIVRDMYPAPDQGTLVWFGFRGWNMAKVVDFERGLMTCDETKPLKPSPTLQKYLD